MKMAARPATFASSKTSPAPIFWWPLPTKLDGLPVNVGSGKATSVRDLAGIIANQLGVAIEPLARGEFRPGEIRSLISDISRIRTIGYEPRTTIEQGIARYIAWIKTQGAVEDYFSKAEAGLRAKGIVQSVASLTSGTARSAATQKADAHEDSQDAHRRAHGCAEVAGDFADTADAAAIVDRNFLNAKLVYARL
jgi:hypothetical protein